MATAILRSRSHFLTLTWVTAALCSCLGDEALGVQTISFAISPIPVASTPEGIEPTAFAAASGTLDADIAAGTLTVTTTGLPSLPSGYAYEVMAQFADRERAALPGGEDAATATLQTVSIGALMRCHQMADGEAMCSFSTGMGDWQWFATGDRIEGYPLSALRSATIYLRSENTGLVSDPPIAVMAGSASGVAGAAAASDDGHAGHSHGI